MQEMQETWVQSLGREDLLEEGMATYFSILAWRIPRTEEPTVHSVTQSQTQLKRLSTHTRHVTLCRSLNLQAPEFSILGKRNNNASYYG